MSYPDTITDEGRRRLHNKKRMRETIAAFADGYFDGYPDAEIDLYEDGLFGHWQVAVVDGCMCESHTGEDAEPHLWAVMFDDNGEPRDLVSVS